MPDGRENVDNLLRDYWNSTHVDHTGQDWQISGCLGKAVLAVLPPSEVEKWTLLLPFCQKGLIGENRWVMEEWNAMRTLWKAGASVPTPVTLNDNVILMTLIGTHDNPAPKLSEIELSEEGWLDAFNQVMDNVRIMTKQFLVHGDLSPYNILYWEDKVWIIDFPQTTDLEKNTNGADLLYRDLKCM